MTNILKKSIKFVGIKSPTLALQSYPLAMYR